MGTSASAGVSADKTGDMNVHEMMNMMHQKFDDVKKSLDEETLKLKEAESRNDDLENELKETEEQRDKIENTIKHLKTKLKRTEGERKNIEKTLLSKQEKYKTERLLLDSFEKNFFYGVGRRGRDAQAQEAKDC
jgi:chromosome segregation ATPase